ncbi:MAG: ATP-binding protein [Candidatus Beckwithbacteria bacterium]|nr:ATP-binding protein [Patescibacteria group bacterium]
MSQTTIPITIAKSHLTAIGERLYSHSLDLVRELVANAYDADASLVKINLTPDSLTIQDNGQGMNRDGLKQYFTIGSNFKKQHPVSEKFKRQRIGEFGIGKFAVLSICDRFELFTQKDSYSATVIFDQADFEQKHSWNLPIIEQKNKNKKGLTRITLISLKYPLDEIALEKRLRQQLPLSEPNFSVLLNDIQLKRQFIPGKRFKVSQQTKFGSINGEIIISALILPKEDVGISINVKGMSIKRSFLGLEKSHHIALNRLTGEIRADFLPLNTARDNYLVKSQEAEIFHQAIKRHLSRIAKFIRKQKQTRADKKADQSLSEALSKVKKALTKNKDIFLLNDLPLFNQETSKNEAMKDAVGSGIFTQKLGKKKGSLAKSAKLPGEITRKMKPEIRYRVKTILKDQKRLVKRLKIGGVNIVCSLSRLGEDQPESFTEGGVIFVNRDHPLFKQTGSSTELSTFHLAKLITQEVVMLAEPVDIRQAYEWQSRLLTDALVGKSKA